MKMKRVLATLCLSVMATVAAAKPPTDKPTIVLVHGAFADSSSWDGVITVLLAKGYHVISASNPLRSLAIDADEVKDVVNTVPGDVILVGHSYGGQVITAAGSDKVKALVYAAQAFMAHRAQSKHTVVVAGASHVVMVSHPATVAHLIIEAAAANP